MKILSIGFLFFLMIVTSAFATDKGSLKSNSEPTARISMLVIDQDPKGTNVRETPGGKIGRVIPAWDKNNDDIENRLVLVTSSGKKGWFQVRLSDGYTGWMHRSVLGACASATEDGDPSMRSKADYNAPSVGVVASGMPLKFIDAKGTWAKMSYVNSAGKKISGWLPEQTLFSKCSSYFDMITINNEMKQEIQSISCSVYNDYDEESTKQVIGSLGGESSVKIASHLTRNCRGLSMLMKDGDAWEFFPKIEIDTTDEISLSLSSPNPNWAPDQFIPHLLLIAGDDYYEVPAGLPFSDMIQNIRAGLTKKQWVQLVGPEDTAKFVLNLGSSSWSMVRAPQYENLNPNENTGINVVSLATFSTPLHHTTLESTINTLHESGYKPMPMPNTTAEGFGDGTFYEITWDNVSKELVKHSILTFQGDGIHVSFGMDTEAGTLWLEIQPGEEASVG